jgi:hypothetical protein
MLAAGHEHKRHQDQEVDNSNELRECEQIVLNVYENPEVAGSVTPVIITCTGGVIRLRARFIGARYRLCRANRFSCKGSSKTLPSHVTSLIPSDWLEIVLTLERTQGITGRDSYLQTYYVHRIAL